MKVLAQEKNIYNATMWYNIATSNIIINYMLLNNI